MRVEVKQWAKKFKEGNKWNVWKALLTISILSGAASSMAAAFAGPDPNSPSLMSMIIELAAGLIMIILTIGLVSYMVNMVKKKKFELGQLFSEFDNFQKIIITSILQGLITFLFSLLLIVPGIIRSIAYSLVQYILADDELSSKYSPKEILDLSKEIMDGHKMDLFLMNLWYAFMLWVGTFTLGILWIWTIPEMTLANAKYATDLLDEYKKKHK